MKNQTIEFRKKIQRHRLDAGIAQKILCSDEENNELRTLIESNKSLPADIFMLERNDDDSEYVFYRIHSLDLTDTERAEYLQYLHLSRLKIIENCLIFLVVLSVIGIVVGVTGFLRFVF